MSESIKVPQDMFAKFVSTPEDDEALRITEDDVTLAAVYMKAAYADLSIAMHSSIEQVGDFAVAFSEKFKEFQRIKNLFETRRSILKELFKIANPATVDIKFTGPGDIPPTNVFPHELLGKEPEQDGNQASTPAATDPWDISEAGQTLAKQYGLVYVGQGHWVHHSRYEDHVRLGCAKACGVPQDNAIDCPDVAAEEQKRK